jgi:hypothetical protein
MHIQLYIRIYNIYIYNIHTPVSGRAKARIIFTFHHEHQGHHEGQEGQELNIYTTTTATTNPITSTTKGKSCTPTPTLLASRRTRAEHLHQRRSM